MSNEQTAAPAPKRSYKGLIAIGVALILASGVMSAFDNFRRVSQEVVGMESDISEVSKKEALADLANITNKLKVQGNITKQFQLLEAGNVKTNMDSQRLVALGVMSFMNSDLRSVGMPTNGLMELKNSAEFSKILMGVAGTEYDHLKGVMVARANKIQAYEKYMADPVNAFFAKYVNRPSGHAMNLQAEKDWTVLPGNVDGVKKGGVIDPVNPLGKNADLKD
jgi:hypothetical protein